MAVMKTVNGSVTEKSVQFFDYFVDGKRSRFPRLDICNWLRDKAVEGDYVIMASMGSVYHGNTKCDDGSGN